MAHRHPARPTALPTIWLMTDERQGEALWEALRALPRGSGLVFRHHLTGAAQRSAIFSRVLYLAERRGVVLAIETTAPFGITLSDGRRIARVHSLRDAVAARRSDAVAVFVSPVFATRTHPGRPALGLLRAVVIARAAGLPAIALGGVTPRRYRTLARLGFHGWAAIDGLTPARQKRKAVPI